MRAYIQKHKFGNATADDLVDSIATAADKGADFKHAFKSFLNQSGVPYVQTKLEQKDGKTVLHLSQSRYLPVGSTGDSQRVWGVPVCVRYGTADGSKVSCEMLDKASGSMVLAGASKPTWVMPNADAQRLLPLRHDQGRPGQPRRSRSAGSATPSNWPMPMRSSASFRHGDIDAGDVLAALKPLTGSKTAKWPPRRWARSAGSGSNLASTDAQRATLDRMGEGCLPAAAGGSWATSRKAGEADDDSLMRSTLAGVPRPGREAAGGACRTAQAGRRRAEDARPMAAWTWPRPIPTCSTSRWAWRCRNTASRRSMH